LPRFVDEHFTRGELRALRALRTPAGIQKALEAMPYHHATTAWSPRRVLHEGTAHCLEGAVFAAAALRALGFPPLLLDLEAVQDTDHVMAVYRVQGHWGAIAKSNFSGLRYREPVYRGVRELVMSYFDGYVNFRGERTLRAYSARGSVAVRSSSVDDQRERRVVDRRTPRERPARPPAHAGDGAPSRPRRPARPHGRPGRSPRGHAFRHRAIKAIAADIDRSI
jgi:hypothetical protein